MIDATPLLRTYARFRAAHLRRLNPVAAQERVLRDLIRRSVNTRFGKDHSFGSISTVQEYQKQVPLRTYEDFWNSYWKEQYPKLNNVTWPGVIPYFGLSSGTSSGTTKYIPLSADILRSNNKAGLDLFTYHVTNRPDSRIFAGKSFMLGGSTDLIEPAPGIFAGDLSGISVKELPWWARSRYFPPEDIALLKNWEEKIEILGKRSLSEGIRMISGVPSWLLIFFHHLLSKTSASGKTIGEAYPDLEMLVHGGVSFAPYYKQFKELLSGSHAELREVYPASEGFIAVADRGYGEGMRMSLDHGIFYEFVPVDELGSPNPKRLWVKDVEIDVNYAVVLSNCAGLWSYILGDTVKFVDTDPPRILVTGRTSYSLSAFGEHLIASEVEDAVTKGADALDFTIADYSVGASYPSKPGDLGGHIYIVEIEGRIPSSEEISTFSSIIDKRLSDLNEDYEAHRAKGFGLKPPEVWIAKPGMFAAWMKSRGKLGGQNKVPRLVAKKELFDDLKAFYKTF